LSEPRCGLVLVGAGSGLRLGGVDKAWIELAGKPMFMHSLERFLPEVSALTLVVRAERVRSAEAIVCPLGVRVVAGGTSRQESVWNGLRALPPVEVIGIHDVARPFAPVDLLREGIRLVSSEAHAAAIPSIPLTDTIKLVDSHGVVQNTIDRSVLRAVQTPQLFRAKSLLDAHAELCGRELPATDDAALLEERGERVVIFQGSPRNMKVTTALDLQVAELLLAGAVHS
jgi:2-C-methyl-D-erythritol 4-phosphate cytidylyltransferase